MDERAELKKIITIVETWDFDQPMDLITNAFKKLEQFNQDTNKELWGKLIHAIYYNKFLYYSKLAKSITTAQSRELVAQGYWWYNTSLWGALAD